MNRLFWIIGMAIALVAFLVLLAGRAWGQGIDIPLDTVHRGDPGEVFLEGAVEVQAGRECVAVLTWTNNKSEHPDTDIMVGPITFFDVEQGVSFTATATFIATGIVEVYTRLGADGVTSGGGNLEVTCNPPTTTTTVNSSTTIQPVEPTTTTTTPSSTTSITTRPPAPTSTLSPPPSGPVEAGGGSEADNGWTAANGMPWPWWGKVGAFLLFMAVVALGLALIVGGNRKEDPPYE